MSTRKMQQDDNERAGEDVDRGAGEDSSRGVGEDLDRGVHEDGSRGVDADGPARRRGATGGPCRRGLLLILLAGVIALVVLQHRKSAETPFYAPYLEVVSSPHYPFQRASANPSRRVVLGFVIAASASSCQPSWGGSYSLTAAASSLQLEARIARLRAAGGEALVSFGGQSGTSLASACGSASRLAHAYEEVIERYHLRTIDLDVEGSTLSDEAATERSAAAIASLQRDLHLDGGRLGVWLTLPVTLHGLGGDGVALVREMLAREVNLTGVNAMTMDFGARGDPARDVLADSERALVTLNHQLQSIYREAGKRLSAAAAWSRIGATPMIGANDVRGEALTIADARSLTAFARRVGLGRLSMWSLSRDEQCPAGAAQTSPSGTCSGVAQRPLQFSEVFERLDD